MQLGAIQNRNQRIKGETGSNPRHAVNLHLTSLDRQHKDTT
jgi:hypothetical protein